MTSKEMIDWVYKEILVAQDNKESMRSVSALIVAVVAKWGADNVRGKK
jgi:hypothetical protein